ncbi:S9 family peptidase [Ornithinicoccus halotolerans]|uniref:S9 family peptidase n=1 Tax=Ornithinicoccus halotolerans TaxID=1748220 RepID=UPI001E4AE6F0|nr:alpha/beta fold hydrolase [Ornithinicoccus halotolerans]
MSGTSDSADARPGGPDPHQLAERLLSVRTWTAHDVDADGRVLAGHDDLGSMQLVEIGPDGTRTPLTDLPGRCVGRYLPGQRAVVVQHDAGGDENWQLSLLELPVAAPAGLADLQPLVRDPDHLHVLQDVDAATLVYFTNRRNGTDMDVVVRDLVTGQEEVVYDRGGYVTGVEVSHDRGSVVVTRLSLRPASTVLDVVGPRAGAEDGFRHLTDPDEHALHSHVSWTADDTALVLASNRGREFAAVCRAPADGGPWQPLVTDDGHDLACWLSPDGGSLLVARREDGTDRLTLHEPDGTVRHELDLGEPGVAEVRWAPDSAAALVTVTSPTEPGAVHLVDAATGRVRTVASSAADMDPGLRALLRTPRVHRVPTPDGEQVPCFAYSADGEGPLAGASVVHVHGGPEAAANQVFVPVIQLLAASGLTVLVPNVRGSTGYGKRWYSLDDVDRRLDSVADLAALHDWLPTLGLDPARAALWGGSYGGYMVLAGVSMQPERWAAGVDIVGMSSLVTFLENTSGYRRAYREREYGSLEHDRALLEAASPITYLDRIEAPLFVIHGANDPRVPLGEAEQIKAALDANGVRCELRVYHDEGHGLARRVNRLDAYPAALTFLAEQLAGPAEPS